MVLYDLNRDGFEGAAEWLRGEQITVFSIAPSALRRILETPGAARGFPHVRAIRMRSEPLFRDVVELAQRHFSEECVLLNAWGMTEVVMGQCYYIDKRTRIEHATAPVGYSTANRQVHLLDEAGKPVPFGEVGEIAIQASRPGSGYWRRADLHATRHRAAENGEWLFLSGDLGRFLPDGALLHLGRKDFMLKIRGHLVETAEIELALKQLPGVQDSVVVGKPNRAGEPQLVAYFVAAKHGSGPAASGAPSASEMRRHLARTLPEFMLPARYVRLERLPLNENDKVDRLSLPEPTGARPDLDALYLAPRTPVEEQLAHIWAATLGLERVGIHDPFLELGGDSLLAAQLAAAVVRAFEIDVPPRILFETPTIAQMALAVDSRLGDKAGPEAVTRLLAALDEEARP
jgi:acyl-coenzyme A synthetase/AMP-(fatty) acid ligase/acyl carrier protein